MKVGNRSHPKDIPSTEEILDMMAKEAKRQPTTDNHFPDFTSVNLWLQELNINTNLFKGVTTLDDINKETSKIKPIVIERTLKQEPIEILKTVENYLGEEDLLEKVDIAIVFGGQTLSRAEKGVEVYLAGLAGKLLMTGKSPNYKKYFDRPEAKVFKKRAVELGVPERAIICESSSINIPSNVRASLNLLDDLDIEYQSIASIISWYAQRRAWCTLKKYLRPDVKVVRVNAKLPATIYEKGQWYKTGEGIEIIFNEFVKLKQQEITNAS